MQQLTDQSKELISSSETYKDAYSRINAIVVEGEQEAHENYLLSPRLLPDNNDDLVRLSKMERRHKKGFRGLWAQFSSNPRFGICQSSFSLTCIKISKQPQQKEMWLPAC